MSEPLAIDLFTGLHGWSEGLVAEGWRVVGFDLYDMCKEIAVPRPDGVQLVLQDIRTIHGKQFAGADLIVASPPCQDYSYMAMPWSRAKAIEAEYKSGVRDVKKLTELFDACFRIQREACEAAGHHIPMVVENVRGAEKWVGRAKAKFGSFHLWGDVPALMPITAIRQAMKAGIAHSVGETNFHGDAKTGKPSAAFDRAIDGLKAGGTWFDKDGYNPMRDGVDGLKNSRNWWSDGEGNLSATTSSKCSARKAASAMIAKIPFVLSTWIAHAWRPIEE